MSRGPGRVEQAIEAAFTGSPEDAFSVAELGALAYPGLNRVEKRRRVAILRAADKVVRRLWWTGRTSERPGGAVIYFNLLNVRSYALGHMRRGLVNASVPMDQLLKLMEPPQFGDPWRSRNQWDQMQPGGAWWFHVEMNKAQKAGDLAEVERLRAELHASENQRLAAKYPEANGGHDV
ncbi:hypothetical protein [Methylobacterium sp. J-076]|uniref:hypothetical protein n=1 Tax=Methylobacterium sp. J-076 TaxID=2836655 RepID=UPI001FBB41E7|nr:hypothetical protein [Methylobacterium sp. J-076]MCJ2011246.1 hypothetical protein [Methylobacterium sp. J-076]